MVLQAGGLAQAGKRKRMSEQQRSSWLAGDMRAIDVNVIRQHMANYKVVPTRADYDQTALDALNAELAPERVCSYLFVARLAVTAWMAALDAGEPVGVIQLRTHAKDRSLDKTLIEKDFGREPDLLTLVDRLYDRLTRADGAKTLLTSTKRFSAPNRRLIIYLAVRRYAAQLTLKH